MTQFVWHYAPWAYLPRIVQSGAIIPSNAKAESELPMLWFSAHQFWEPTATKVIGFPDGSWRALTFREQVERFGCIRFGLASDDPRLIGWKRACAVAITPREMRRAMERAGRKKGADPKHWFACSISIALAELTFQVFVGEWGKADPDEMANVWTTTRGAPRVR
jgi:hypothetical protein